MAQGGFRSALVDHRRWWIYVLAGSLFGVVDFYFQHIQWPTAFLQIALIFGIWLVPLAPVALHEARLSRALGRPALAGVLTWSAAIVAYYVYLFLQLVLIMHPTRPEMHISSLGKDPYFLDNVASVLVRDVLLYGIVPWIGVAIIGGGILGRLVAVSYHRTRRRVRLQS
ncbi:hypothetical protein GA0111570_103331 [Raineyella antarctica]|uniref:Uncharacterized protein n=1 Tax=Raineyella antarctica TaxID=1577474 RepID=A0A1G6GI90_9ACTN|nr:hypothetical protein [Raineyella antarctica]SDB81717.1 hypothetical protein GA0111570_103331 [Raineyella antarctica]